MIHAKYNILNPKQEEAEAASQELARVLETYLQPLLTFVFDRGYASGPWLEVLQTYRVTFVIRWIN